MAPTGTQVPMQQPYASACHGTRDPGNCRPSDRRNVTTVTVTVSEHRLRTRVFSITFDHSSHRRTRPEQPHNVEQPLFKRENRRFGVQPAVIRSTGLLKWARILVQ